MEAKYNLQEYSSFGYKTGNIKLDFLKKFGVSSVCNF